MATLKTIAPTTWVTEENVDYNRINLRDRFNTFADGQKSNHTLWFLIILIIHGVFFLPVPAVLMFNFNAPVMVLIVTMTCFFTNLIANMGGAGIRATILFFAASILIHLVMVAMYVL